MFPRCLGPLKQSMTDRRPQCPYGNAWRNLQGNPISVELRDPSDQAANGDYFIANAQFGKAFPSPPVGDLLRKDQEEIE